MTPRRVVRASCARQGTLLGTVLGALLGALAAGACGERTRSADPAVTVFTGQFVTLDSLAPRAEAIAVRDGRIVAVGSRGHVDSVAGPGATHEPLPGVVVPGFTDAHVHAASLGDVLESVDLRGLSKEAVLERVAAAAQRAPAGAWIRGGGWDQSFWTPPDYPIAAELDAVSAGHPVILDRIDGHAVWVNGRALQLSEVDRSTIAPPGGRIVRDATGAPSGVLVDDAIVLVRRVIPPPDPAQRTRRLRLALAQYAQWGLTGIHDAGATLADIETYRLLLRDGPLPVRAYLMATAADSATLDAVLAQGPEIGSGDGTFSLRAVKLVDDGALGSRGARLSAPYSDERTERGLTLLPPPRLDSLIARILRRGFQVAVHAIGDGSTRDVLDAFERAGTAGRASRFRLEHVSMLRDADVPRLARLGVIASMQPVFVGEYARFAEARVGAARLPWVYRTRDVVLSGATLATGTDFPASDTGDPLATLASLVTRQGHDGTPAAGWLPEQRVGADVALRSMTAGAAFAAFEEGERGMLRTGHRADLTVLSDDPLALEPSALRALVVLRTIVGGRTTYQR